MNILLVEDDDMDARAVERQLRHVQQDELTLRRATSLEAALAQLAVRTPDLAIVDMGLPDSRGLETVRPLVEGMPDQPVIVLTGDDDERMALAALGAGAADYLVKGVFDADGLKRAMRYALERKRSECRIRAQADLLNRTQEAIVVCSLEGEISYWNSGARSLFDREGAAQPTDNFFQLLEMKPEQITAALNRLRESGNWGGEITARDGRTLLTKWTISRSAKATDGEIVAMSSDVSEQKAVENQLRRSQRMEGVGALACGIAHDFNNLLTPIVMTTDLLRQGESNYVTSEGIDAMAESARRGAELVRQLLTFGRGADGQHLALTLQPLLKEITRLAHSTFPKSVRLVLETDDNLAAITGVATQIHQVLLNLVVNARDAMPEGGEIVLRARNRTITEDEARQYAGMRCGNFVELKVTDTGFGIPEELRDRIFEPFFTTKQQQKGTGLGLSTTLGILKSHNASIHVHSEVGVGSTFRVLFPVATRDHDSDTDVPGLQPKTEQADLQGKRVLVVDDNENVRAVIELCLTRAGVDVVTAMNGQEALELLLVDESEFDLILTDIDMPVMGGEEFIKALRRGKVQTPLVCMTGFLRAETAERLRKVDQHMAVLRKPLTAEEIVEGVVAALNTFQTKQTPKDGLDPTQPPQGRNLSPDSLVVRLN